MKVDFTIVMECCLFVLLLTACSEPVVQDCEAEACRARCPAVNFTDGDCRDGVCICFGATGDGDADADGDVDGDVDGGVDRDVDIVVGLTTRGFTYSEVETFVLAASYYGGTGASEEIIVSDLARLAELGFNNVRVWATWNTPTTEVTVVRTDGSLNSTRLDRLKFLIETAQGVGMTVDVTFGFKAVDSQFDSLLTGLVQVATELSPYRNVFFDVSNEFTNRDKMTVEQVRDLAAAVKNQDAERLLTASSGGAGGGVENIASIYAKLYAIAGTNVDFAAPHLLRDEVWAEETAERIEILRDGLLVAGWDRPIYLQEPARRGYLDAEWPKSDFLKAVAEAAAAGAAGWCFHTEAGFDLTERSFFDNLDDVELDTVDELAEAAGL